MLKYLLKTSTTSTGLNPYFIGLPILIKDVKLYNLQRGHKSQSLFYWITYSYKFKFNLEGVAFDVSILILLDYLFLYLKYIFCMIYIISCLNPYFIGLPILIIYRKKNLKRKCVVVSILILLDYLFL